MAIISKETFSKLSEEEKSKLRERYNLPDLTYNQSDTRLMKEIFNEEDLRPETVQNYEIGDVVRIKNREWYDINKNSEGDIISTVPIFDQKQSKYCGQVAKIVLVIKNIKFPYNIEYALDIDDSNWRWSEEMFDRVSEKELQDMRWNSLEDKEKESLQFIYTKHPEWEDVKKSLEIFGKHNLIPKPVIKTWDDFLKEFHKEADWNPKNEITDLTLYGLEDSTREKIIATAKIAKLIEVGYGGRVTENEWKDKTLSKYSIVPNWLDKGFHRKECKTLDEMRFIAFHTYQQADLFMSFPENMKLIEQYYGAWRNEEIIKF